MLTLPILLVWGFWTGVATCADSAFEVKRLMRFFVESVNKPTKPASRSLILLNAMATRPITKMGSQLAAKLVSVVLRIARCCWVR